MKDLHDPETRVSSETGGEKGKKVTQLGAIDPLALIELGRVAGMGADKYAAFNYLKGYDWSLSFNAMMRHALLFWAGEDTDPESGWNHMAHAAWMALALVSFSERGLGNDDRYTAPTVTSTVHAPNEGEISVGSDRGTPSTVTSDVSALSSAYRFPLSATATSSEPRARCDGMVGIARCVKDEGHGGLCL